MAHDFLFYTDALSYGGASTGATGEEKEHENGHPHQIILNPLFSGGCECEGWDDGLYHAGIAVEGVLDVRYQGVGVVGPDAHHKDIVPCVVDLCAGEKMGNVGLLGCVDYELNHLSRDDRRLGVGDE